MNTTRHWFERHGQILWERHLKPLAPFDFYLEIGVFEGDSLLWAAENLLGPHGLAIGVDPWASAGMEPREASRVEEAMDIALQRIADFNKKQPVGEKMATHVREDGSKTMIEYLAELGRPSGNEDIPFAWRFFVPDLIQIDGDHHSEAALCDLVLAWKCLRAGGILVCDDLQIVRRPDKGRMTPGSGEAWAAFESCYQHLFEVIYRTKRQIAVRKKGQ